MRYDYSIAIELYKEDGAFKILTDKIETAISESNIIPPLAREACELAVLKSYQDNICPKGAEELYCYTENGCGNIYCAGPVKKE